MKATGSKGFHIAVPLDGAADVEAVARFADHIGGSASRWNAAVLSALR